MNFEKEKRYLFNIWRILKENVSAKIFFFFLFQNISISDKYGHLDE